MDKLLLALTGLAVLGWIFWWQSQSPQVRMLTLSYGAVAYRAAPVIYAFEINAHETIEVDDATCCTGDPQLQGLENVMSFSAMGDPARVVLHMVWSEVHSGRSYRATLDFTTDAIVGWTGGPVPVVFSFRPGGGLDLMTEGPALAATRPGGTMSVASSNDLNGILPAPELGRAVVRSDFVVLRSLCGMPVSDPPPAIRPGLDWFDPATRAQLLADRRLPLPDPTCFDR